MLYSEFFDYSDYVPEDMLEEVLEYEKSVKRGKSRVRYPSSKDIVEAVKVAAERARGVHPHDFPEIVYRVLEEWGFSTKFVTIKRIWRTYETLVLRGIIRDVLNVVKRKHGAEP